jgi:release factor glutamine methyltransferase
VAAEEEADEILTQAANDGGVVDALVARRLAGEPLAWVIGSADFGSVRLGVDPGVYVPRWQSLPLARRAAERLPEHGVAIDVCTGSGALAVLLGAIRPRARVVATDIDQVAVSCARKNGVEAYRGDLLAPVPPSLLGTVDVVVAVVPYVPTPALPLLPRDTLSFESTLSYDGGPDGTAILRRVTQEGRAFLRPGGALLLEVGGEQSDLLADQFDHLGYVDVAELRDEDGDLRGVEATWGGLS